MDIFGKIYSAEKLPSRYKTSVFKFGLNQMKHLYNSIGCPFKDNEHFDFYSALWDLRYYSPKERIINIGDVNSSIFFIVDGCVVFHPKENYEESIQLLLTPGNFFIDYGSFLLDQVPVTNTTSDGHGYMLIMSKKNLEAYLNSPYRDHFYSIFFRLTAEFHQYLYKLMEIYKMKSHERVLNLQSINPELFKYVHCKHIANFLNIEKETFSRVRKKVYRSDPQNENLI